ncbi:hypothetical protein IWW40_000612 [Coemansia sp. RSA 1250]|nr:hypothetical protein IWW40_000612 [Coemansia sp. RSA 1250]
MVHRQPSITSCVSLADTVVDPLNNRSNRTQTGRLIIIAIKPTSQDRSLINGTASSTTTHNHSLIDRTLSVFHITRHDTVLLVNVRQEIVSAKTKCYDSSIAAYASIYGEEERQRSLQLLHYYQDNLLQRGLNCRALALLGDRHEQIIEAANREHADCIVVGLHRKHRLRMKRSFSTSLMQSSTVPVTGINLD